MPGVTLFCFADMTDTERFHPDPLEGMTCQNSRMWPAAAFKICLGSKIHFPWDRGVLISGDWGGFSDEDLVSATCFKIEKVTNVSNFHTWIPGISEDYNTLAGWQTMNSKGSFCFFLKEPTEYAHSFVPVTESKTAEVNNMLPKNICMQYWTTAKGRTGVHTQVAVIPKNGKD